MRVFKAAWIVAGVLALESMNDGRRLLADADCTSATCADRKRTGSSGHDRFGAAVAAAGFVNSGDKEEIAVGAPYNDQRGNNAGRLIVYRGDTLSSAFGLLGLHKGDRFGHALAGRIDVNGDHRDDLIVGAPYNNDGGNDAGRVYVFSGKDKSLVWSRKGQKAGDHFGFSVANAGDVNDDGVDDVIIGAPGNDYRGSNAGRAYVYSGVDGKLIWRLNGLLPDDMFGYAVAGVGDVNDDGYEDVAVSAIGSDVNGPNGGHITIFSGMDKSILQDIDSQEHHEKFGWALAATEFVEEGSLYTMLVASSPLTI
jgi:large repetitive protein